MGKKTRDKDPYPFLPHMREEWGICPFCGGKQIAELFLGEHFDYSRAHLCLKCRHTFYNHLVVIERCKATR